MELKHPSNHSLIGSVVMVIGDCNTNNDTLVLMNNQTKPIMVLQTVIE